MTTFVVRCTLTASVHPFDLPTSTLNRAFDRGNVRPLALATDEVADGAPENRSKFLSCLDRHAPTPLLELLDVFITEPRQSVELPTGEPGEGTQLLESRNHHLRRTVAYTTHVVKLSESTHDAVSANVRPVSSMATFEDRIEWILTHRGFASKKELAESCDVDRKTLDRAIQRSRGKPVVRGELVEKIARQTRVNRIWLETGDGVPDLSPEGTMHVDPHEMRVQAARMIATGLQIDIKDAWMLMMAAKPGQVTVEGFYNAAVALHRASQPEQVAAATFKDATNRAAAAILRRKR